jgi:hypothetical protein
MPRRFPIFQFPNPPLIVAGLAGAVARLADRRYSPVARLVSHLALLVWALEEVIAGANWFRRVLLGLGGGGYALSRLLQPAGSRRGRSIRAVTALASRSCDSGAADSGASSRDRAASVTAGRLAAAMAQQSR